MKSLKRLLVVLFILIFTFNIGCSKVNGKDTQSIKVPYNESLEIKGTWRIENVDIIDNQIENKDEILSQKDSLISICNNKISIFNKSYKSPSFKLKVVDNSYILSYELNLTIKSIIDVKDKVDVISLIDSNKLIGEFIIIDDNNGYLFYYGLLLKVVREDTNPREIDKEINMVEAEVLDENYDSDVGAMIALKTSSLKDEDGSFLKDVYRTLWVSFKNDKLQPVLEKENIIFPRLNGIWTIENKIINKDNIHGEYFMAKPIDRKNDTNILYEINKNLYKSIDFISNDYISIEKFKVDDSNNISSVYRTIPIDNINSNEGLSIEEIYLDEGKSKYERSFNESFEALNTEKKNLLDKKIDYTNFTIKRIEGKWNLVGNIISNNFNGKGLDFKLSINPSNKILNYDTLLIPWKELKLDFPFIEDAYTAPTGRIGIIIFKNKLYVYEIEDRNIKGSPLITIDLNEGENVIMVEWASKSYVETWEKAFKDGIEINIEEE